MHGSAPGQSEEGEEWRPVPGVPSHEVSNLGQIRNAKTGRVLRCFPCGPAGYLAFRPALRAKNVYVHHAVCEAWHGDRPSGLQVAHLNGDHLDNRPENLAFVTVGENASHRIEHGTTHRNKRFMSAEREARVRLLLAQRGALGLSYSSIERLSGVSRWSIKKIEETTFRAPV